MTAAVKPVLDFWLEAGQRSHLPIAGRSMLPFLRDGWAVEVAHTRDDIRRGDVIAYRAGQRVVVHRVVRTLPNGRLLTKGDWRLRCDPPVVRSQIIGPVVSAITPWGTVNLTAPWWRAAQTLLACVSCIVGWLGHFSIFRMFRGLPCLSVSDCDGRAHDG